MDIFDIFYMITGNIWAYGVPFLVVLSLLVFVHEWGHYSVAKLCGVHVDVFSIGFGKELFGFNDKSGTRWKFSLIPLGGYVKMRGDVDPASAGHEDTLKNEEGEVRPMSEEELKKAFFNKPVWKRAAIVFAGPGINFLFAILLFVGLYAWVGKAVTPPLATAVIEGSAAHKAGFEPHDKVIAINGDSINRFDQIRRSVMISVGDGVEFTVLRDGQELILTAYPEVIKTEDRFGFEHSYGFLGVIGANNGIRSESIVKLDGIDTANDPALIRDLLAERMGRRFVISVDEGGEQARSLVIQPLAVGNEALLESNVDEGLEPLYLASGASEEIIKLSLIDSVGASVNETWEITKGTLYALGQIITGSRSATELGGIIRIGAIAGDMAQAGLIALISFTAILSINLGLINLFPIPMLDGGHLLFYAVEAVKGSPLSERVQEYAFRFGLVVLAGLMLFANLNDIVQIAF